IANGFWNPFGICVRSDGEIFAADNDPGEQPPCRLLHIVEGGDYGYERSYGGEAHHPFVSWNGELRGTLPMIHPTGEAPCGVLPLGRGLLVPSWSDHRIDFFPLTRKGASYTAKPITLAKGSRYFRPSCIAEDPSAGKTKRTWYLCDWVDGRYAAHGYGRLWKLEIDMEKAAWVGKLDLEPLTKQARLSADLRSGKTTLARKTLLHLANEEDPFLAQAALLELARETPNWSPQNITSWPAEDRIQAVQALKLAKASPKKWVNIFLADKNPNVQFETLRWISDSGLKTFLPEVEKMLTQSDLDYQQFEAAVATLNTLKGTPAAGIRNPEMLLARVLDANSAPQIRAYALRLLPTQSRSAPKAGIQPVQNFSKGLTLKILQQLLTLKNETLSLEVVRTLSGNPIISQNILVEIAADTNQSLLLRAEAIAGLAAVSDQQAKLLFNLLEDKQRTVREEALRSLRSSKFSPEQIKKLKELASQQPESADMYQALLQPKTLNTGRPALTDTQAWLNALDAVKVPADPENGRRIFHHSRIASCAHCHRHGGRGNVVGPDLSHLGNNKDRKWLLKSILEPSLQMAPEYQPRTIILNDGRTFTGIRLRSYIKETIRDANGQNRTFDRNEVDMIVESTISFMPSGLVHTLTDRELKDLIAFLESNSHQK
ncbi:MAG: c-type cytochrome, partial [Gimesia sp.]